MSPKRTATQILVIDDAMDWMRENVDGLKHGSVTLVVTVADGRIMGVKQTVEVMRRA